MTPYRPRPPGRSDRSTVVGAKLLDLLLQPSQTPAGVSPISAQAWPRVRKYSFGDCPLVDTKFVGVNPTALPECDTHTVLVTAFK